MMNLLISKGANKERYQEDLEDIIKGNDFEQRFIKQGKKEGFEIGLEEGLEKGRKEGIEETEKRLYLTFLARTYYNKNYLDESLVSEIQLKRYCFSEEEAKRAIKSVNEDADENNFVNALKGKGLIQQSSKK